MANVLFVTDNDLKRVSVLSGNIDANKLVQFMEIAHDTHMQQYMGTDLFNRIREGIENTDLTTEETELLNTYIKPMARHWCIVTAFPFIPYTASNKGVFKHTSENSETVTKEEIDSLVANHRNIAQNYTRRFIEYMEYNSTTFPQYTSNTNNDIVPTKTAKFGGWQLS